MPKKTLSTNKHQLTYNKVEAMKGINESKPSCSIKVGCWFHPSLNAFKTLIFFNKKIAIKVQQQNESKKY
jgi:hypothetical protein